MSFRQDILDSANRSRKKSKKTSKADKGDLSDDQRALWEKLRSVRLTIAKEEKVPAYVVFADRTLMEMAKSRPANHEDMAAIHGVGEHKLNRYGERFLKVCQGLA